MPVILTIDTAMELGQVGLFENDRLLAEAASNSQKEHASFLQPSIDRVFRQAERKLSEIDAVAVTIGPGSYTGLRVSLATAKGLCYALGKPLIGISTLEVMARSAISTHSFKYNVKDLEILFCPLIDARRLEVFTAVYDQNLLEIMPPTAMILEANSFENLLAHHPIVFSGNGFFKLNNILNNPNVFFSPGGYGPGDLAALALERYNAGTFENTAYVEPFYLKGFHNPSMGKK